MDIAAEETSSPLQGFKFVKPFTNFFQAAKQRFANLDPESGVHLVGPMFELTACIDKEKGIQDFDAVYPETGVSFGPTICSFGLPYNDHNYALPVGLTPPAMAPHLMDINLPTRKPNILNIPIEIPKSSTDSEVTAVAGQTDDVRQDSFQSLCLIKTKSVKTPVTAPSPSPSKVVAPPTKVTPLVFASLVESTAGLSESKKALFAAWHAKAAASGGTLPVQQRWKVQGGDQQSTQQHQQQTETQAQQVPVKDQVLISVPRYCKSVVKESEGERVYLESDMKIIEVPEDLCVSPSKLSSLESSDEEDPDTDGSNLTGQGSFRPTTDLAPKPAIWSTVNCLCEVKVGDSRMLQCLNCRYLQHMECMEIVYEKGACTDETDPTNITPKERLLDPSVYLCPSCLRPPFTVCSEVLDRVLAALKQRESAKQLNLLSLIHHHAGKSEAIKHPIGGAQLLASATDRARQLGLIGGGGGGVSSGSRSTTFPNTDERHKMSCIERQNNETTDVNRRIPSPPRASKRKQDLTTTSFDVEVLPASTKTSIANDVAVQESPSSTVTTQTLSSAGTPSGTPVSQATPFHLSYHHHMKIYSADGTTDRSPVGTVVTVSSDTTPTTSPMTNLGGSKKKQRISSFGDSPLRLSTGKRGTVVASTLGSAWAKDYREADMSVYSENLLAFVAQRIASGRERVQRLPPTCLGRTPLCRVVMFDHNDKGLEASARLGKGEVVTEIRGNLMLLEEYEHFIDPINDYNRYVMIYHNFGDRAVAINTSQYGNDARFIRRSCIPNCFLDHFVVCNKLRVIIRTTQELMPGVELTIPFDFDYRSCRYTVKCACARSRCPVQKWCRKLARHKVMPYLDYGKFIESRLNALSKPITEDQSPTTTPSSTRTYSTENSPLPISSTQKTPVPPHTPTTSSSSPQRFVCSTKRPFPSARLFTTATTNTDVAFKAAAEAPATGPISSLSTVEPPAKKRPESSPPGSEDKKGSTKGDTNSSPPFEPIITTRRQAAKAAAAAMTAGISKKGR